MADPLAPCGHELTWFVYKGDFMAPILVDVPTHRLPRGGQPWLPDALYWCRTCGWVDLTPDQYRELARLHRDLSPSSP